jgi:branched-chain amino acid transport system ATP-binding protein
VTALTVEQVTVRFGGNVAVDDVSIEALPGSITGLIGPNGAGKTTLFNVITGLHPPSAGRVSLDGRDVTRLKPAKRARLGLARTFQRLELFGVLTAHDNVRLAAHLRGAEDPHGEADRLLEWVGVGAVGSVRADRLPTGQARLVELARACACKPTVLLLDEPASGLSEAETHAFAGLLRALAAEGMAVLLVEHDVPLVLGVCERIHVLDAGRLLATGAPSEIRDDPRVHDAYLGGVA